MLIGLPDQTQLVEFQIFCFSQYLIGFECHCCLLLQDNDDQTGIDPLVMAVIVTKTGASSDSPKDIGIVIEGKKVVTGLLAVSSLVCRMH